MTPNKKTKIIHIIPTLGLGGAERLIVDLADRLDRERYELEVIALKRLGYFGLDLKRLEVPFSFLGQRHGLNIFSLIKLIRMIKDKQPDIVHTHLFGADFYGIIAARLAGVPVVVSTEHNLNYAEGILKRWLKKLVYKLADKVIAVSGAVSGYLEKQGIEKAKIAVIHNGVKLERFLYDRQFKPGSSLQIGSVGRLSPQKGYLDLVRAIALMENRGITCQIAGEGEQEEALKKEIARLNLQDRVKLVGPVKDVAAFMKRLDLFVLPSHWEGFGLVVVEAGLTQLPVISTDVDGIREIITDRITGLVVAPGHPEILAQQINYLSQHLEERIKLGLNLQKRVIGNFSIEKMVKSYEKLYKDLLIAKTI